MGNGRMKYPSPLKNYLRVEDKDKTNLNTYMATYISALSIYIST